MPLEQTQDQAREFCGRCQDEESEEGIDITYRITSVGGGIVVGTDLGAEKRAACLLICAPGVPGSNGHGVWIDRLRCD